MSYTTRIRIGLLDKGTWEITVRPEALQKVQGLPSGKVIRLERQTGDVQVQEILVKPYYRRFIGGELHIFAVQVLPL